MRKFMFKAAVLTAVMLFSSCANGEENVESVTVALTTETLLEQLTEETTTAVFLGDYTEPALPDSVTVFGTEYPTDGQTLAVTVDADLFSKITEEDLKGIEILKSCGLERLDVLNCKEHDLSFLAKTEMSCIRFYDMEGNDFEYLRRFTAMERAELEGFGGNADSMGSVLSRTANVKEVTVSYENFDVFSGIGFCDHADNFSVKYYPRDTSAPNDRLYVKASPFVNTYSGENSGISAEIFNPTDEDILVDGVAMYTAIEGDFIYTSDGLSGLNTEISVPAGGSANIDLTADMFDYAAKRNNLYCICVSYGEDDAAYAYFILNSSEERGLDRITLKQRELLEKAQSYIPEMLSADTGKTAEDYTDAFTLECAERIMSADLEKVDYEGDGNCFSCITGKSIKITRYTAYSGEDGTRIEMRNVHMVRQNGNLRIDHFEL